MAGLRGGILARFLCRAACIGLNYRLGRPRRGLVQLLRLKLRAWRQTPMRTAPDPSSTGLCAATSIIIAPAGQTTHHSVREDRSRRVEAVQKDLSRVCTAGMLFRDP